MRNEAFQLARAAFQITDDSHQFASNKHSRNGGAVHRERAAAVALAAAQLAGVTEFEYIYAHLLVGAGVSPEAILSEIVTAESFEAKTINRNG